MVKDGFIAWREQKKPIYSRMPSEQEGSSYQDYKATEWLLSYWDQSFVDSLLKCEDLTRQFDPLFCDPDYLDFLAPLCGWTPPYWDSAYPVQSKRFLLSQSYSLIWSNKGSREVLSFVLTALEIEHKILIPGSFILGTSQVSMDQLGSGEWEFDLVLPRKYIFNGKEFKLAKKICILFVPAHVLYRVRY